MANLLRGGGNYSIETNEANKWADRSKELKLDVFMKFVMSRDQLRFESERGKIDAAEQARIQQARFDEQLALAKDQVGTREAAFEETTNRRAQLKEQGAREAEQTGIHLAQIIIILRPMLPRTYFDSS